MFFDESLMYFVSFIGYAALAEGENIQQNISNATINVVGGNQNHETVSTIHQAPTDGNLGIPLRGESTFDLCILKCDVDTRDGSWTYEHSIK